MAIERTVNPYATYGPNGPDGISWAEYFRAIKRGDKDEREAIVTPVPVVLARGRWCPGATEHEPSSAITFYRSLEKAGFEVRGIYATFHEEGGVYGDGAQKAGEQKPDRDVTKVHIAGVKGTSFCRIEYESVNGKPWKCTWRQINGQYKPVSDTELRGWIKDAMEQG